MEDFMFLKEELDKVLFKDEIVVDDIYLVRKGKYNFLTIVLDKTLGIDLDTIVYATNIINPIVDKYEIKLDNIIKGNYILDVVSKERGI